MITPAKDRMRKTRERRRRGAMPYLGEITQQEVEFLAERGYMAPGWETRRVSGKVIDRAALTSAGTYQADKDGVL